MQDDKGFSSITLHQEHLERLYTPDIDPLLKRGVQHEIRKLIVVNVTKLLACVATLVIHIEFKKARQNHKYERDKLGHSIFGMILLIFGILNAIFDLTLAIYEHLRQRQRQDKMIQYQRWDYIHLIINIIGFIVFLIFLIFEFISCSSAVQETTQLCSGFQLIRILLLLLVVVGYTLCVMWSPFLVWSPKYRFSGVVLFFSSTILICISIVAFILNKRMHFFHTIMEHNRLVPLWCYKISQLSASYTVALGSLGISLAFIYGKGNRLSAFRGVIRYIFYFAWIIGIMIVTASTLIHRLYDKVPYDKSKSNHVNSIMHADRVLSILRCFLLILIIKSLRNLRKLNRFNQNGLKAQRIQLSKQSPAYIKYLAATIDACNQSPDGMTGHAALQLMIAYEEGQLENVSCIVLRMTRPARRSQALVDDKDDTEALALITVIHNYDTSLSAISQGFWSRILARTLGSQNCIPFFRPLVLQLGLLGYQWPFRTGIFHTKVLDDSVSRSAEILQSIIEWNEMQHSSIHCDVLLLPSLNTEPIARAIKAGGFLEISLPSTHMLDLRPHHGKTWKQYVKTLKRTNRRPYLERFIEQGGVIEEIHDLSRTEVGAMVCHQWDYIARFRNERNEPRTLARPNSQFITSLGASMIEPYRSVVFLRLNNEVIGSSVIFRFPNKLLTTDLHGHNHETSRPVKGYFVMLQWTIKDALEKNFDFIDFGPTTPGPKMDLGCIQLPLQGGAYCGNPIISYGISKISQRVDIIHMKKEDSKPNDPQEATKGNIPGAAQVSSLTKENRKAMADIHHCHASGNDSYVVEAQDSTERKVSASAAVISQLDNVNNLMLNSTGCSLVRDNEIELSDKEMLCPSKSSQSIKEKKPVGSTNNHESRRNPPNKRKSSKIKNQAKAANQEVLLPTDDETVLNEPKSPNAKVKVHTPSEVNKSNGKPSAASRNRPQNSNSTTKTNQNKASNSEMTDKGVFNTEDSCKRQQHQTTTNLDRTQWENNPVHNLTCLIHLSTINHSNESL
ncbi:unnamed protein product [Rotaria socialis]|nr:unnamed protein product [Rotaria socialis]CAF3376106.1 unnamed protein product [Rotaria socialis]CAF3742707.1 unnamed protein product [Rotaria socialis]CAF4153670.1 unnamed protein product [Rotaria socialis]CAF4227297.1 unnamed protein product [Rotaria socialis]